MDKLNQKVERILRTKPRTRNDDFLLINEVYKEYISTKSMSFDLLSKMHRELELPPFESITRARQRRIKELVEQGIDKTLAAAMIDSYVSCGILNEW